MTKHGTGIEWTHIPGFKGETWNPIVGCSVISPGCTNCYAMSMAARLEKMKLQQYMGTTVPSKAGPVWTGRLNIASEQVLTKPLRWSKPRAIFVNSMGDLFHEDVLEDWVARIFAIMALCPQHIFIVLTKRSERMRSLLSEKSDGWLLGDSSRPGTLCHEIYSTGFKIQRELFPDRAPAEKGRELDRKWPLPNVWLGVSVEDQVRANERIPDLLTTPASRRFLSCEPLLAPVDLRDIDDGSYGIDALSGEVHDMFRPCRPVPPIDWVIAGGESGHKARPVHPYWISSLRDQCAAADVPFFFKQWGEWMPVCEMTDEFSQTLHYPAPKQDPLRTTRSKYDHCVIDAAGTVRKISDGMAFTGELPMGVYKVGKGKAGSNLAGETLHNWPEVSS